jgi:hypothetical protein
MSAHFPAQPRFRSRRRLPWLIALVVVVVAGVATTAILLTGGDDEDGAGGSAFFDQGTPEAAAAAFARAATEHNAAGILALTCADQQDDAERFIEYTDYAARADEGMAGIRMSVTFDGIVSADADETTVALSFRYSGVTGELRDEDSLTDRTAEFDLSEAGGRWFVCDDLV